jgi:hypothetical protein
LCELPKEPQIQIPQTLEEDHYENRDFETEFDFEEATRQWGKELQLPEEEQNEKETVPKTQEKVQVDAQEIELQRGLAEALERLEPNQYAIEAPPGSEDSLETVSVPLEKNVGQWLIRCRETKIYGI